MISEQLLSPIIPTENAEFDDRRQRSSEHLGKVMKLSDQFGVDPIGELVTVVDSSSSLELFAAALDMAESKISDPEQASRVYLKVIDSLLGSMNPYHERGERASYKWRDIDDNMARFKSALNILRYAPDINPEHAVELLANMKYQYLGGVDDDKTPNKGNPNYISDLEGQDKTLQLAEEIIDLKLDYIYRVEPKNNPNMVKLAKNLALSDTKLPESKSGMTKERRRKAIDYVLDSLSNFEYSDQSCGEEISHTLYSLIRVMEEPEVAARAMNIYIDHIDNLKPLAESAEDRLERAWAARLKARSEYQKSPVSFLTPSRLERRDKAAVNLKNTRDEAHELLTVSRKYNAALENARRHASIHAAFNFIGLVSYAPSEGLSGPEMIDLIILDEEPGEDKLEENLKFTLSKSLTEFAKGDPKSNLDEQSLVLANDYIKSRF